MLPITFRAIYDASSSWSLCTVDNFLFPYPGHYVGKSLIKSHFLKEEWSKEFSNFGRPLGQQKPKSPPGIVEGLPTCLLFFIEREKDHNMVHV